MTQLQIEAVAREAVALRKPRRVDLAPLPRPCPEMGQLEDSLKPPSWLPVGPSHVVRAFRPTPTRMNERMTRHSGKPTGPINNPKSTIANRQSIPIPDLYRTLDEPGSNPLRDAHARLDTAVRTAYAIPTPADILAFLLGLNQTCAAKEAAGEKITPPGLPLPIDEQEHFITANCITPKN